MATFAEQMLTKIETVLAENPGVESVMVGKTSVKYSDLLKQREHWKSEVARENGNRPRVATIKVGGW